MTRVLSGAVLVALAIAIVWFAPPWLFQTVAVLIVMLGVWPFLTSIRSWQRKEPLAGLAVCAAVVAVLVALFTLSGH